MARTHETGARGDSEDGEIVIPHAADFRPVSAVRNVLIQSSLGKVQESGHFERYKALIDPEALEHLLATLGPGWIPLKVADAHYAACDKLRLSSEEIERIGQGVGDRVQETSLISAAKRDQSAAFDVWANIATLHRVWARIYQGGSVEVVKVGERVQRLELVGFVLGKYRYYRLANVAAISSAYAAVGVRVQTAKLVSYDEQRDELVYRLTWS